MPFDKFRKPISILSRKVVRDYKPYIWFMFHDIVKGKTHKLCGDWDVITNIHDCWNTSFREKTYMVEILGKPWAIREEWCNVTQDEGTEIWEDLVKHKFTTSIKPIKETLKDDMKNNSIMNAQVGVGVSPRGLGLGSAPNRNINNRVYPSNPSIKWNDLYTHKSP